jgi:glycosyltransferase involved in cell wall biosynthesis
LVTFIRSHNIQIVHAHDAALFTASAAALFPPFPAVVWHDHYGQLGQVERPVLPYRLLARRVDAVISVSEQLADWARTEMKVPSPRVWHMPNFVCAPSQPICQPELPGKVGHRIVCVAGFRAQKDHITLVRALSVLKAEVPDIHLLLVGGAVEKGCLERVEAEIRRLGLNDKVSILGERQDVPSILSACTIGVLSSAGEAFPLTLLEYGAAGLPVVSTQVGQCADILDQGKAGLLVPPGSPETLAAALSGLMKSEDLRLKFGARLQDRVNQLYGPKTTFTQLRQIYSQSLMSSTG